MPTRLSLVLLVVAATIARAQTCPPGTRSVSFVNDCGAQVWVGAVGNRTHTVAGAPTCAVNAECAANQYCDATITTECTYIPVNGTVSTTATACTTNGDCPGDQFCYTATGTCASLPTDGNGWSLGSGTSTAVCVAAPWAGRFWPRTGCTFSGTTCSNGTQCCDTGSCLGTDDKTFSLHCALSAVPPATLAELALLAYPTSDTYDVSNVDGFNVPLEVAPNAGTYDPTPPPGTLYVPWCGRPGCATGCGSQQACTWNLGPTSCPTQMLYVVPQRCTKNTDCPTPTSQCTPAGICTCSTAADCGGGQVCGVSPLNGGTQTCGTYAGCYSANAACAADPALGAPLDCGANAPLFGCTGAVYGASCYTAGATSACCGCPSWSPPGTCQASNAAWTTLAQTTALPPSPVGSAQTFHDACPTAYSYQYDDKVSTFNCLGQSTASGVGYTITFCPGSTVPGGGCTSAADCPAGDPCTQATCTDGKCGSQPLSGFPGVACVCGRTNPSACADTSLPRPVSKRVTMACRRIEKARDARKRLARMRLGGAAMELGRATQAARRLGRRDKLSAPCASALEATLGDARERARALRREL